MLKNKELSAYNSGSKFELEISKKEYEKEQAEHNIAKINTQRCTIYAPYDGKVVTKLAQRYQNVQPNQELLEIVKTSELELKIIVPASWLTFLKKDQKFSLLIDETGQKMQATIKELGAVIDTSSQTITLRAAPLKPYGLLIPGMSATANFNNTQN
jgi:multidrug efflux pump subunit AcrA (membrane-fusion protein)